MLLRVLLVCLLVAPVAAGDVLTVAQDGTGDFPDVVSAVAAAQDGDIILVDAGCYAPPVLVDRDLTFVAREEDSAFFCGTLEVRDQSADKTVLLSGLWLSAVSWSEAAVELRRCRGPVRFDKVRASSQVPSGVCGAPPAVRARRARDVAFLRSELRGGLSGLDVGCFNATGGHGLLARNSSIAAWRSLFYGGHGSIGAPPDIPTPGGDGAQLIGSQLFAFYDLFQGGDGGHGLGTTGCAKGGAGVRAEGSVAWDQSSLLVGGEGGTGAGGSTCDDGQPYAGSGHQPVAGPPRALEGPRLVEAGSAIDLDVYAPAGEYASLAISHTTSFRLELPLEGGRLVGQLAQPLVPLGQVDGDQHLPVSVRAPQLAPGEEGTTLYLQLVMQDAGSGITRLGSPITVVVVQPGT